MLSNFLRKKEIEIFKKVKVHCKLESLNLVSDFGIRI